MKANKQIRPEYSVSSPLLWSLQLSHLASLLPHLLKTRNLEQRTLSVCPCHGGELLRLQACFQRLHDGWADCHHISLRRRVPNHLAG